MIAWWIAVPVLVAGGFASWFLGFGAGFRRGCNWLADQHIMGAARDLPATGQVHDIRPGLGGGRDDAA